MSRDCPPEQAELYARGGKTLTAAAHAAAVRRRKDAYTAARAAAMRIKTQPERDAALAKAQQDYDACKKSADTARY